MPTSLPGSMEAGSKDTVAIAGLEAALKWLPSIKPLEHERAMAAHFIEEARKIDGVELYCAPGGLQNQAGVVSFGVRGFKAIEVAAILDNKYDIAVRAGHHCAALIHQHLPHRFLYDRVSLTLPATPDDTLPTNERILRFTQQEPPALAALYYLSLIHI